VTAQGSLSNHSPHVSQNQLPEQTAALAWRPCLCGIILWPSCRAALRSGCSAPFLIRLVLLTERLDAVPVATVLAQVPRHLRLVRLRRMPVLAVELPPRLARRFPRSVSSAPSPRMRSSSGRNWLWILASSPRLAPQDAQPLPAGRFTSTPVVYGIADPAVTGSPLMGVSACWVGAAFCVYFYLSLGDRRPNRLWRPGRRRRMLTAPAGPRRPAAGAGP